jgi:hypothetical protein
VPKIRLILEDDNATKTEQTFALEGDLDTLDGIDEAVEQFRLAALPQVEKTLLEQAQERSIAQEKKTTDLP